MIKPALGERIINKEQPFSPSARLMSPKARNRRRSGSIADVGWRFRVFRISKLELVDQTGIEPVTS
jgi:hypothetical protein